MNRRSDIDGTVAIVTGAAQGLGEAIARTLAADGAIVALADLQVERAAAVADELNDTGSSALGLYVDVSDPMSAEAMATDVVQRFGRIDLLVNNAGIDAPPGHAYDIDEAHWRRLIDVDLSGQWWCTRAVLPHMRSARSGRIIFISSEAARRPLPDTSPAYNAAKAGLIGLTVGLAGQLERDGILVNALTPGPAGFRRRTPETADSLPLGYGGAEPVARMCRFLAGEGGSWISGAVLNVSGGVLKGM